jgi:hypothetical protein
MPNVLNEKVKAKLVERLRDGTIHAEEADIRMLKIQIPNNLKILREFLYL